MRLEDEIKQKNFRSDYQKGVVNIIFTFNWLDQKQRDLLKPFDITSQQYNILRILRGQFPNPATINLLKERMLDKMCDASRLVDRLLKKKLVERKTCENDRRAVDIIITQEGLDLLQNLEGVIKEHEKFMHRLSEIEIKTLNELLDKLRG
ncbi:MAG: MarR family transcriptional regulator [Cytophagaceae bacterium]|jgi:DNA-binding MarR family transcriptional regulator|nr:MarR family transcriptional regulator [Cytophagaceae bacterium]